MKATGSERRYRPTESKYKGEAHEMYVTYDLEQKTRSDGSTIYPKLNDHQLKAGGFKSFRRTSPPTERENG